MASESDIYDPTQDLPIDTGADATGDKVPAQVEDQWSKVQDKSTDGFRRIIYRDGAGSGPRRVIIEEDRDGGFHVDQTNEDWPNHTNWLTDEAAREEDRVRNPVPFDEAIDAAVDYMEASDSESTQSSKPYDPTIEFDDPLVEEEFEAAGIEPEDLAADEERSEDVEPPESVAGWELTTEEADFISWAGDGGRPPAGFIADETSGTVTALSHGGRWENRWTTRVKYVGPDRDGEERSTTSTIASFTLTSSSADRGFAKNRARAIEAAVEWMEDHPSQGAIVAIRNNDPL